MYLRLVPMSAIRVMIVEDSKTIRLFLERLIADDPRFDVVASCESGEVAMRLLPRVRPDVISLDIRLPGMNGFEVTRRVMQEQPTPIVVCSASVEASDLKISMNALAAGALTVVEKSADQRRMGDTLLRQLALMSAVKVVRQRFNAQRVIPHRPVVAPKPGACDHLPTILGITSSTGGPQALARIVSDIAADFPASILLVQHMTEAFHQGFVDWLRSISAIHVKVAEPGESPAPGVMYVAPADKHLRLVDGRLLHDRGVCVSYQRPSGTVLLESLARELGEQAIGVVLTGMGNDGDAGLAAIHAAGGHTIVEDESTAVVFGMPKAAIELGAAKEVLPLPRIAARLNELAAPKVGV